jgi:hypothetical protein
MVGGEATASTVTGIVGKEMVVIVGVPDAACVRSVGETTGGEGVLDGLQATKESSRLVGNKTGTSFHAPEISDNHFRVDFFKEHLTQSLDARHDVLRCSIGEV